MTNSTTFSAPIRLLLFQPIAALDIQDGEREERNGDKYE
jgi:hypothetical protein